MRLPLLVLAIALGMACLAAPVSSAQDPRPILIRGARVFDGVAVLGVRDVLIENGTIQEIAANVPPPPGAEIVDGTGKTLIPGLFDCHTHIISEGLLEQALVFGVTTELDMFMWHLLAAELRKEDVKERADFRTAGTLVTAPGGHGTQYGLEIPTLASAEDADAFVEARIAEGSDYIKIVYDDGSAMGFEIPTIDREALAAVIGAAHRRQKLAVVHIHSQEAARQAIDAGADGLVHIFADHAPDPEVVQLAKERGVFVVATLAVIESVAAQGGGVALAEDPRLAPYLRPGDAEALRATVAGGAVKDRVDFDAAREAVRRLHAAGVPILCGTDAPNPGTVHGASVHRELELLTGSGLTPAEALAAATSAPAKVFGLEDRGRIAEGLRADVVLVEGDPTTDITSTRAIAGIWKKGRPVDRKRYREVVEKAAAAAAKLESAGTALVSDFEGDRITASFGFGWQLSTDSLFQGKSTATMDLVEDGAAGTKKSLRVRGTIDAGLPFAWAGAIFYPGQQPFAPADLSKKKSISFWARGDGKEARVLLFAEALGRFPAAKPFTPAAEWKRFQFELSSFHPKIDGKGLLGVLFTGGPKPGDFEFQIDEVAFE